jgi:hypothetical protein
VIEAIVSFRNIASWLPRTNREFISTIDRLLKNKGLISPRCRISYDQV